MGYASIEVSPVGEAEYPLIQVLFETISGRREGLEFPEGDAAVAVMAHLEGNPLGFALGEVRGPECVIRAFGVLREYRRQGIGGRLIANVAGEGRARGCHRFIIECTEGSDMGGLAESLGFARVAGRYVKELPKR